MKYYFAPMEGFTGYSYRRMHRKYFPGIDKYFTPFISATQHHSLSGKDKKETSPVINSGAVLVPQILTKVSGQLVWAAEFMDGLGYDEINLNLGCPSATVVTKGKGSGMLKDPEQLTAFFAGYYAGLKDSKIKLSVKTRLGFENPEECIKLLEVYNNLELNELIIHPRTQKDFYGGSVHMDFFRKMYEKSRNPVVYNGDLLSAADCRRIELQFPDVSAVMIGRGLLINPALVREARGGKKLEKEEYRTFLTDLFNDYSTEYSSRGNAMSHMKDLWKFSSLAFRENPKGIRAIQKSGSVSEYQMAVNAFFRESELLP